MRKLTKRLCLSFSFLVLVNFSSFAQNNDLSLQEVNEEQRKILQDAQNKVDEENKAQLAQTATNQSNSSGESQQNRQGDVFYLGLRVLPLLDLPRIITFPNIEIGGVINSDYRAGLEYGRSTYDTESGKSKLELKFQTISFAAKAFFGNSFNLSGGISQRNADIAVSGENTLDGERVKSTLDMKFKVNSLDISLGNEWQWESGFVLGFDWLTLHAPFNLTHSYTLKTTRNEQDQVVVISDKQKAELDDDVKEFAKTVSSIVNLPGTLSMYIGWSF